MGYFSAFKMKWEATPGYEAVLPLATKIIEEWIEDNPEASFALNPDGSTKEEAKWYRFVEDVRALTLKVPGILITVDREGEESGDVDRTYFFDAKVQTTKAKVSFEPCRLLEGVARDA